MGTNWEVLVLHPGNGMLSRNNTRMTGPYEKSLLFLIRFGRRKFLGIEAWISVVLQNWFQITKIFHIFRFWSIEPKTVRFESISSRASSTKAKSSTLILMCRINVQGTVYYWALGWPYHNGSVGRQATTCLDFCRCTLYMPSNIYFRRISFIKTYQKYISQNLLLAFTKSIKICKSFVPIIYISINCLSR